MKHKLAISLLFVLPLFTLGTKAVADVGVSAVFSKGEVSIIAEWYSDHGVPSSHGKGGKKSKGLPPGIAKNLARGKPLPPGIAKQVLPQGLVALLPAAPHGYERIIADGKVLLVEVATHVIHDILEDVILH
jgi:hypothetical protein